MRDPKEVEINGKKFILHKFNVRDGRYIMTQYPISAVPKLGEYKTNEELALKILGYVSVNLTGTQTMALSTWDLIDNHVLDWETQLKLEYAMVEYNFSFLALGGVSTLFDELRAKLPQWIIQMSIQCAELLSQMEKPHSANSRNTTPSKKASISTK